MPPSATSGHFVTASRTWSPNKKKKKKKRKSLDSPAAPPPLPSSLRSFLAIIFPPVSLPSSSLLFFSFLSLSFHRNNLFHSPRTEKSSQCAGCVRAPLVFLSPLSTSSSSLLEEGSSRCRRCNNHKICNSPA